MENLIDDNSNIYKGKYRIPSTRLQMWDYSRDGWYFVTICVDDHQCFFGEIENEKMILNNIGKLAEKYWLEIPNHFVDVKLDYFVVMPNHVHGIIVIEKENVDENNTPTIAMNNEPQKINDRCISHTKTRQCLVSTDHVPADKNINKNIGATRFQNQGKNTISSIVGSYKSICTKMINKLPNESLFVWQHRFYDEIIRNEIALKEIRQYIDENPLRWDIDRNNLNNRDGWINKIKNNPYLSNKQKTNKQQSNI